MKNYQNQSWAEPTEPGNHTNLQEEKKNEKRQREWKARWRKMKKVKGEGAWEWLPA